MGTASQDRILDFGPMGMWWEITQSTADTGGELFEAINVLAPTFAGPPVHVHPTAEESYAVVSGTLAVCVGGKWWKLAAGESVTVPAGTPHTLKNESGGGGPAGQCAQACPRVRAVLPQASRAGGIGQGDIPPKGLRSAMLLAMLFSEHPQEVISVKPPRWLMSTLARAGRILGHKLPPEAAAGPG